MSLGSSLLRLLLCIALAFNGVSTARAGMYMHHMVSAPAQSAALEPVDDMAGMPCHSTDQDAAANKSAATDPDPDEKVPTPDCCKGGCQCACMQQATPAIAMVVFPALVMRDAAQQRGMTAHAPPAALRLNRPPIG